MSERIPVSGKELDNAQQAFIRHIITEEVKPDTLRQGWQLFERAQNTGLNNLPEHADEGNFHIREIVRGLTEGTHIDTTSASFAHLAFRLQTHAPMIRGEVGPLLKGLQGNEQEKAISFCKAMDKVGWRDGDLEKLE